MSSFALGSLPAILLRKTRSAKYRVIWKLRSKFFRLPTVSIDAITSVPRSALAEPIVEDRCMPPFPGMPHDDMGMVLRITLSLQPRLICEIGTAHGNLAANILRNCSEARLITVNARAGAQSGKLVTYELADHEIGRVYRKYGYQDRVCQVLIDSLDLDLARYTAVDTVDVAIIDGCHDVEFVLNDFEKVRRFIRRGGIVLFHDTHPSQQGHLASSYRACLLLRSYGFDVRWVRDSWWAYWKKPILFTNLENA